MTEKPRIKHDVYTPEYIAAAIAALRADWNLDGLEAALERRGVDCADDFADAVVHDLGADLGETTYVELSDWFQNGDFRRGPARMDDR